MPETLRLEAKEFTDLTRWRWTLTEANGAFLADHEVRLDPHAERFEAFTALHDYITWHAAPDKRPAEEARIVTGLGDWIGTEVLGPGIGAALVARRPATVEVILPAGAEALAYLPLEAARVQGRSLAACDITLVIRPPSAPARQPGPPVNDRLRVLGLFSLPEGGSALNLRRERQSLVDLIRGIVAAGRAAEIRVLQYGVTRDRLRDILDEAEGWDLIHVSGHGTPGELVLETDAGAPDPVSAADLADLLDTARDRVKLVTLSACSSAALTASEQRRLLGLPVDEDQTPDHPERIDPPPPPTESAPATLATVLTGRLGCAVLAMRFPVGDEFAIALAGKLYDLLARQGQPLPRAVAMSLRHFIDSGQAFRFPALSMAAPAIFGPTATSLTLKAPDRTAPVSYATENLKMAGFPPQPGRFVGRTAVMARASAALAADSRVPGVLLHGMPGGGKTACALELAYTHEHAFDRLVWFKAPDEGTDITGALTDFALTLERELPGFQMIHVLADDQKLTAFLPRLTELLERSRLLIVIDNAESLLTDTGQWRDQQWTKLFHALTSHTGLGRIILTTRRVSAETRSVLHAEAVDALTADEALLLARELPNLRRRMATSPDLARPILEIAQGHPKLLELADGQAANPDHLAALTQSGTQAWHAQGGLPEGFFTTGEPTAASADYLHVLAAWTKSVTDTLTPAERDLFWFLCCLEEPDRIRPVVAPAWPGLWQRLGRAGQSPGLDQAVTAIAARGLTAIHAATKDEHESYAIHPGVAGAGHAHAGQGFHDAADSEAATYWEAVFESAYEEKIGGRMHTRLTARVGLAAVPYLVRRHQWDHAAYLLEHAFSQDPSRTNAAAVLPASQKITRHDPSHAYVLGAVLQVLDPAAAETQMRILLDAALACGDYRTAAAAAYRLAGLRLAAGSAEAFAFAGKAADYAREAGLGPWSRLLVQLPRLQVLNGMGQARQVLFEITMLRRHIRALPDVRGTDEITLPWSVRELILDIGRQAASRRGLYAEALAFNAERMASKRDRRASAADIARARFDDYYPLLRRHRADEALALLLDCRQIFDEAGDIDMLGRVLSALADVEDERGHGDAAVRLERDALRYKHRAENAAAIATSYHNLGEYPSLHASQPATALASHLAAALIRTLTGINGDGPNSTVGSLRSAAVDLREFGTDAEPPANIADLCHRLADIEGTDLPLLIAKLSPDPETAEQTLRDLIAQARQLAEAPPSDTTHE